MVLIMDMVKTGLHAGVVGACAGGCRGLCKGWTGPESSWCTRRNHKSSAPRLFSRRKYHTPNMADNHQKRKEIARQITSLRILNTGRRWFQIVPTRTRTNLNIEWIELQWKSPFFFRYSNELYTRYVEFCSKIFPSHFKGPTRRSRVIWVERLPEITSTSIEVGIRNKQLPLNNGCAERWIE